MPRITHHALIAVAACAAVLALGPRAATAATFNVTSTADPSGVGTCDPGPGGCTLREAVAAANATVDADRIAFSIPGAGPHTINLVSPSAGELTVERPVDLDGTSQPGYDGRPVVEIVESAPNPALRFSATGASSVRGLAVSGGPSVWADAGTVTLAGNHLGLRLDGSTPAGSGVRASGAGRLVVGGDTSAERNVIASDADFGAAVRLSSPGSVVQGNYIGVDRTGSQAVGARGAHGVAVEAPDIVVGGSLPGEGNVISGTVLVQGSLATPLSGVAVRGNVLGLDAAGTSVIAPNDDGGDVGVWVAGAAGTVIGGDQPGSGNRIAGYLTGIRIEKPGNPAEATGTVIQGNTIGPGGARGVLPGAGVRIGGRDTTVGGLLPGEANAITGFGTGVVVDAGSAGNRLLGNRIAASQFLGISLSDFFTPSGQPLANDPLDLDGGANEGQNHPALVEARVEPGATLVSGTLDSRPNADYRVELFVSGQCDPSGNGEGEEFLAGLTVRTDASGRAGFATALPHLAFGKQVTATATDSGGNTSEFSRCRRTTPGEAYRANVAVSLQRSPFRVRVGEAVAYTATVRNLGPAAAQGAKADLALPAFLRAESATATAGGCQPAGAAVSCALGNLPNQGAATVTVLARAVAAGIGAASLVARSDQEDAVTLDNAAQDAITVDPPPQADLAVALAAGSRAPVAGGRLRYIAEVRNLGPGPATRVRLRAELPEFVPFVSATPFDGACRNASDVVTCDLGPLSAGDVTRVTIIVAPRVGGPLPLRASVSANEADPAGANNAASVRPVAVLPPPETGETVNLDPQRGRLRVRPAGDRRFRPIVAPEQVRVGSEVDARDGRIVMAADTNGRGRVQRLAFSEGRFVVRQRPRGNTVAVASMSGSRRSACRDRRRGKRCRRLWGKGRGRFGTRGNYGATAVRGTEWLTEDGPDGTLVVVRSGVVTVQDFARRRTVTVRAGRRYLAPRR